MSRVKNSTRNIIFAMLAYVLQVLLGFLTRRYFIYIFNEEFLGVNSLFTNVLSVLSLAELGFGSALVFAMYKPMAENNEELVRQLLYFYKKCYMIIGVVVAVLGMCVLPFMEYFRAQAPNVEVNLYIIYFLFLFNSVISYFFSYRRSLLYTSQREDIESKITMAVNIFSTVLQLVVLIFLKNYYVYILITVIATLLTNGLIYVITQKKYKKYIIKPNKVLDKEYRNQIKKNVYSLIFHRIGEVVVFGTDSLIIYIFLDAATLGKYSNYLLIISYVTAIINIFRGAIRGGVGNSIALESREKNNALFKKLSFINFWIVSFCTVCIFVLADAFIDVVIVRGSVDLTLNLDILLLVCISFFLTNTRNMVCVFKECAGLFYQDRYKAIIEALINLTASIVFVKICGLSGVILGTIISTLTTCLWVEPKVLYKYYFKMPVRKYFGKYIIYTISMLIAGAGTYFVCSLIPSGGLWLLILRFAVCAVVPNVILLACLFWMPEFKECVKWGLNILKGFRNKKRKEVIASNVGDGVILNPIDLDKDGITDIEVSIPVAILEEDNNINLDNSTKEIIVQDVNQETLNNKDEN